MSQTVVTIFYSDGMTEQSTWIGERGEAYAAEMRVWQMIEQRHPENTHRIVDIDIRR